MADTFVIGDYRYTIQNRSVVIGITRFTCVSAHVMSLTQSSYGSLTNSYIIIDGVTIPIVSYNSTNYILDSIYACFENCTNLVTAPIIPRTIINFGVAFRGCTSLTSVILPTSTPIPEAYHFGRLLNDAFSNCVSLVTPPSIPSHIRDMSYCFYGCTSLQSAPDLSNTNVSNMDFCFYGCTSLLTPPILPQNLIYSLISCFRGCSKLQSAPIFYNGESNTTTNIHGCYYGCSSLSGDVYLPNNISSASNVAYVFSNTGDIPNRIYVHTKSEFIDDIVATSSFTEDGTPKYTAVAGSTNVNICNTRRLTDAENTSFGTTNGVRIDMLIDGSKAGIIEGLSRSGIVFYNAITNTQITFPTTLGCVRSYAIVDNVPNIPTAITFKFLTRNYYEPTISVYAPCTAQPCDLIHDGDTNPMSIDITTQNVIVHGAGSDAVTLYTFLGFLYRYIYPSTYGRLIADFIGEKTDRIQQYDGTNDNTKHINMTADSIKVTNDSTLQDVITQLYNDLSGT